MIVVDTDVPIDLLRGYAPAVAWFESLGRAKVFLSGFSALELLEGCRNRRQTERLLRVLASHRIVWPAPRDFDRVLADFALGRAANKIGLADAMIGETAVGLDVPIHTFNVRHFRAIPGLLTVQPYLKRR